MTDPRGPGFITALAGLFCLTAINTDVLLPALPLIEHTFAVPPGYGQFAITVFVAGFGVAQLLWGPISDVIGRKPVIMTSLAAYILFAVLCAQAESFAVLVGLRFLQGIFGGAGPTIARAIVQDVTAADKGGNGGIRLMSFLAFVLGFSPILGPIAGSLLLQVGGWSLAFWFIATYGATVLLLAGMLLSETNKRKGQTKFTLAGYGVAARRYLAEPDCRVGAALVGFTFGGFYSILTAMPTVARDLFAISGQLYGFLFALVCLGRVFGALISRQLAGKWPSQRVIGIGVAALLVGTSGFGFWSILPLPQAVLWVAEAIYVFGVGLILPGGLVHAVRKVPEHAGAAAAFTSLVQVGSGAALGAVAGLFYDGTATPMITLAGLMALCTTVLFFRAFRRISV